MKELVKSWQVVHEDGTIAVAAELAQILQPGDRIVLNGGLGAGKTTLIRYLCNHYQIPRVTSPTFALVNVYTGTVPVYHFDFYRLSNSDELFEIGFYEYMEDGNAIAFIEWGAMFPEVLPQKRYDFEIEQEDDEKRCFKLYRTGIVHE